MRAAQSIRSHVSIKGLVAMLPVVTLEHCTAPVDMSNWYDKCKARIIYRRQRNKIDSARFR